MFGNKLALSGMGYLLANSLALTFPHIRILKIQQASWDSALLKATSNSLLLELRLAPNPRQGYFQKKPQKNINKVERSKWQKQPLEKKASVKSSYQLFLSPA